MRETPPTENLFIDRPEGCYGKRDRSLYPEAYGRVDPNGHPTGMLQDHDKLTPPIPPPGRDLSDEAIAELGKRMYANPKAIETNIEMHAYLQECDRLKRETIERHGCCGEGHDASGYCFGYGRCPRHLEVDRCLKFVASVIEWLNESTEQTGLAAVAARLDVSSPFIESENCNV